MNNNCKKIVFLSQFSESSIRERLCLKSFLFRKVLAKIRGKKNSYYQDFAIWVSEYMREFEKHKELEFHFVGPHRGMKRKIQHFERNGVYYHFFKSDGCYLYDLLNSKYRFEEKNDYLTNRKRIKKIVEGIQPDMIIMCGAENPNYAWSVSDIKNLPFYVILQTLLNDPKRIEMGVGTPYRRMVEAEVFKKAQFFCTSDVKAQNVIKGLNNKAVFLLAKFPTHKPRVIIPEKKTFDFVFFSRNVTSYKGIEDLLKALSIVKKAYNEVTLNVIGGISEKYSSYLSTLISKLGITQNVVFSGFYERLDDTYKNVVTARVVTVPGITASLNSTIREAMLIGMPTICYETEATDIINQEKQCLLTAPMGNIESLAQVMIDTITEPQKTQSIAKNGKEYATQHFGIENIVNALLENCHIIIEEKMEKK